MNWEYSCGAVVFTRENGHILFAVVQEQSGAYSFPKGHMENNETEMETARREILEETGLNPDFLPGFKAEDEFTHHSPIRDSFQAGKLLQNKIQILSARRHIAVFLPCL